MRTTSAATRTAALVIWLLSLLTLLAPTAPARAADEPGRDRLQVAPEDQAAYAGALELIRENRYEEALPILTAMGRRTPTTHVLGLLVAAVASARHDRESAKRLMAAADAAPDDLLAQFMAGVSAHYCGHVAAATREEKAHYYELALRYLPRTLPAYQDVLRVWIYLAVSHYRLGHQADAEQAIDQAVQRNVAGDEADAYYCRAEIRHRKDPLGAVADIDTYLGIMAANVARGAFTDRGKEKLLRDIRETLLEAADGGPLPDAGELFDPIRSGEEGEDRGDTSTSGPLPHPALLGLLLVAAAAGWWWWRRRRATPPPSDR